MAIVPDAKDWTWVLERACPACGFVAEEADPSAAGGQVLAMVPRWRAVLARQDARERPDPSTWSALEYGCHVRDVLRVFGERSRLIREQDDPLFVNWDQDVTAIEDGYDRQDPATVAEEIAAAAAGYAAELDRTTDWTRPGRRSNGSVFTAASLTTYGLHDLVHHLVDVRA